jgi:hypothetical protein
VPANRIQMKGKKRNANLPRARRMAAPLAIVLLVVLAAGGFWWSKHREADALPVANSATTTQTTNAPSSSEAVPAFEKLKGRWLRAEGSYIVEVRSVEPGGKMDAAYFNPRPINVAKAEALKDGDTVKVFVELRDMNYPGTFTPSPARTWMWNSTGSAHRDASNHDQHDESKTHSYRLPEREGYVGGITTQTHDPRSLLQESFNSALEYIAINRPRC